MSVIPTQQNGLSQRNMPAPSRAAGPVQVVRAPRRKANYALTRPLLLLAVAGALALMALVVVGCFGFYAYYQVSGLIIPGVRVGNTALGGMTVEQAAIALHASWNLETRITLSNGKQSVEVSPAELGLALDPVLTAQRAFDVGHGGNVIDEAGQFIVSLAGGWPVIPAISLDMDTARQGLEAQIPQMSQPARDAALRLEGENLSTVPGEIGYTINIDETLRAFSADPQAVLMTGRLDIIPLPVLPQVNDVSPAIAQAQALLNLPASIQAYDAISDEMMRWQPTRQEVAGWLKVIPGMNGGAPQVTLDQVLVGRYLDGLSAGLGEGRYLDSARYSPETAAALSQGKPALVIISHAPTTYIVQAGDTLLKIGWRLGFPFWTILDANPGLDAENLLEGTTLVIPSQDILMPLPVIPDKRIVISISQQHLWAYQRSAATGQMELAADYVISTGIDRSPTQPGFFQVQSHELNAYASVWDLYMPHFLGIYESWPGFMNGIHGLPTLSSGRRLWADILGKPASYGCIILDLNPAKWLYGWADNGVVVEIQR